MINECICVRIPGIIKNPPLYTHAWSTIQFSCLFSLTGLCISSITLLKRLKPLYSSFLLRSLGSLMICPPFWRCKSTSSPGTLASTSLTTGTGRGPYTSPRSIRRTPVPTCVKWTRSSLEVSSEYWKWSVSCPRMESFQVGIDGFK